MKIFDISVPISEKLPTFPGDPLIRIEPVIRLARGDGANVSRLILSSHSGTHIDPPRHFNDNGLSADEIPLSILMGNALLIEIHGSGGITQAELERFPIRGEERIILKTGNSRLWEGESFN